ncbi:MAG: glycosyltransferase family 4 protein [Anaerolineae bacterium]
MKKINILYVHPSDELYGADRILLQLVERLDKQRFYPIVVLPKDIEYDGLLSEALSEHKIKFLHLNLAVLRRRYFTLSGILLYIFRLVVSTMALVRVIQREEIDIVHSNTLAIIPGALAALLTGKPHVWHVHEIITRPRFLWRLTAWLSSRLSEKVVAVSEATRYHLCKGDRQNEEKTVVIHNGIDGSRFGSGIGSGQKIRREWGISDKSLLVGMLGRFSDWKGQDYFLKVASLVSNNHPDTRFALVGGTVPGEEDVVGRLKSLAVSLNLSSLVIFDEFRSDVPAILDAYDVFVLPSTRPDPFPTVILEAMATGKPIVANAHGGSVEMIEHQITGFLVDPTRPEEMASAIECLLKDPIRRREMGRQGCERLINHFSLDAFVDKWTSLYESLASQYKD